jgi:hypothetical protein
MPSATRPPKPATPLTPSLPPDHIGLLIASFVMMAVGWGGLYRLMTTTLPRIGGELWLFFILLLVAITGTAVPIVRYLNVRFTPLDVEVPPGGVIVRQSIWIGLFVVTCAWLQIPRALSLPLALFLILVLVVVEVFLRSRELAAERERL